MHTSRTSTETRAVQHNIRRKHSYEEENAAADAGDEEAEPPSYLHPRAPPHMERAAESVRHMVTKPCSMNEHSQRPPQPAAPPSASNQVRRSQQSLLANAASSSYTPPPRLCTTAGGSGDATAKKPRDQNPGAPDQRRRPADQMQGPGGLEESEDPRAPERQARRRGPPRSTCNRGETRRRQNRHRPHHHLQGVAG